MAKIPYDVSRVKLAPDSFPAPRSASSEAPPVLGKSARWGLAGEVVETILPWTEAAASALLADFLVSFGSAVGSGPHMYADGAKHELKLFAVIVGATSRSRKGTSRANMRRLLSRAAPDWSRDSVVSGMSSGEGLIAAMADGLEDGERARPFMSVETEFGKVLTVAGRMGNTLGDYFRQLWEGDTVRILNKKKVAVDGAYFSCIGHITAEELCAKISDVDLANGFANRVLWVHAERSKLIPSGSGLPVERLDELAEWVAGAIEAARSIRAMKRDAAAETEWHDCYVEMADRVLPGLPGALTSRAEAQALRLSMIYAALDGTSTIRPEHVQAAYSFWRYCEDSVAYVFGDSTGNPHADRILVALQSADEGRLKWSDIGSRLFSNNLPADELARAITVLEERGRVRVNVDQAGTGRPAKWVILT
jgi:hypothetical protein